MRWSKSKKPKDGDTRTRKKFIWFPTCLPYECNSSIEEWRWLETCLVEEMFKETDGFFDYWYMISWVDVGDIPK